MVKTFVGVSDLIGERQDSEQPRWTHRRSGATSRLLFPEVLDELVPAEPSVRVVDAFVEGYFTRNQFDYDPDTDTYRCPAAETLTCGRTPRR